MKKIYLLLLFNLSFLSFGQEFKLAFLSGKEQYYIREEGNNEAWLKVIKPSKKIKNKAGKWINVEGDTILFNIKCIKNDRTYAIGETISYDSHGKVKDRSEGNFYSTSKLIPDSIIEGVCKIIFEEKKYEEEFRSESMDKIQDDLREGVKRYDNHRKGFVLGYLEEKCKPNPIESCKIKAVPSPKESFYAEDPKDDYTKGYNDGKKFATEEK